MVKRKKQKRRELIGIIAVVIGFLIALSFMIITIIALISGKWT